MKAPIVFLLAVVTGSAMGAAATDVAGPTMVQGQTLSAINSEGVAGVNHAPDGSAITIFDSFTGAATLTTTTGSPRTFMGDSFTTATGTGTDVQIDEATLFLASTATQSFSNGLVIRVQFWDDFDGSSATAIFSNPAGGIQTFTVPGPVNLAINTFTQIDVVFAPPITLSGLTGGIDINYQGDNGGGPASTDNLTSLIRAQAEPGTSTLAVGSFTASGPFAAPDWGFYRNAGNQTNFNHPNSDRRTFTGLDDILLALQLRGAVTPVSVTSFGVE
jgi:hypothetical protein